MRILPFIILPFLSAVISCSLPQPNISIDKHSLFFGAEGGTDTIRITSNYNWQVSYTSTSITATPQTGSTDIPVIITVLPNDEVVKKEMTVAFSTYNSSTVAQDLLTISQDFSSPSIRISPSSADVSYTEDTLNLVISSNSSWYSMAKGSEIKVYPDAGNQNDAAEVSVIYPRNYLDIDTTYLIYFISPGSLVSDTATLFIRQSVEPAAELYFDIHEKEVSGYGETFSVSVTSNCEWAASVSGYVSGIVPFTGESGNTRMEITIPENSTEEPIRHYIVVETPYSRVPASDTLFITQPIIY